MPLEDTEDQVRVPLGEVAMLQVSPEWRVCVGMCVGIGTTRREIPFAGRVFRQPIIERTLVRRDPDGAGIGHGHQLRKVAVAGD